MCINKYVYPVYTVCTYVRIYIYIHSIYCTQNCYVSEVGMQILQSFIILLSKASFIALEFQMHCQYPELSRGCTQKHQLTETQYEILHSSSIRRRHLRIPQDHRASSGAEGDISNAGKHDEENTPHFNGETSRHPLEWDPSLFLSRRGMRHPNDGVLPKTA